MKKTLLVLSLVMMFLSACGAGNSPGKVAAQYLEGLLNGDEAVKKYESAAMDQGFLAGLSMVALANLVDKERARDPNFKMRVTTSKVSESGDSAAVELLAAPAGSKDGQGVPCTAKMQNEKNNGWMVVGLSCFFK